MKVSYIILPNTIVVNVNGQTHTVVQSDARYASILTKIKEGKLDEIEPLLSISKSLTDKGFTVVHGIVHVDNEPLPSELSSRLLQFFDEGLPFQPLIKFWKKLKTNPSFNSRQQLFKFLEHNGHPITQEGNFIAYRAVNKEFKDKHTGKMDNSIGNIVEMPRSAVDDNPNNTCSSGLHVATMDYVTNHFANSDDIILDVEVNPADVVAVPTDYNGTKMRVCRFKVVAQSKGLIEKPLVDSVYENRDCPNCGEENGIYDNYCSNCGEELEIEADTNDNEKHTLTECPECGANVNDEDLLCPVCWTVLDL